MATRKIAIDKWSLYLGLAVRAQTILDKSYRLFHSELGEEGARELRELRVDLEILRDGANLVARAMEYALALELDTKVDKS